MIDTAVQAQKIGADIFCLNQSTDQARSQKYLR